MTTAWPPNKQILGNQRARGISTFRERPCSAAAAGPTFAAITSRSYHPGGVNALLADGSVRFIKSSIAGPVWRSLGSDRRRRDHQRRCLLSHRRTSSQRESFA